MTFFALFPYVFHPTGQFHFLPTFVSMNRSSFKSRHFPANANRFAHQQSVAMRYYAGIALVIMMAVVVTISQGSGGQQFALFVALAAGIGVFIANALAQASLRRTYAQIQFVGDHFSLISVHDVLSQNDNHAFPLRYANPSRMGADRIQLHYSDQVITLVRDDWEDFDIIWSWLVAPPAPPEQMSGWTSTMG